jgi:hypothetical protein
MILNPADQFGRTGLGHPWKLVCGRMVAGFEVVLLETRQVKAALSAMVVKTDRKDARGIAQLLRMGWYRRRSTASRPMPRRSGRCWSGASSCRPSCGTPS